VAGSVSGVAGALVSLPLESPHDGLLNTGSVVFAALATGAVAGLGWKRLAPGQSGTVRFMLLGLVAFGIVAGMVFAAETSIDRAISFILPLAGIIIGIQAVGIPLLARAERLHSWWVTGIAVVIVVTLGAVLAGNRDQESGRLEIPPRSANWDSSLQT
jgi:drug/metabolite transporter (DMT)-like permease